MSACAAMICQQRRATPGGTPCRDRATPGHVAEGDHAGRPFAIDGFSCGWRAPGQAASDVRSADFCRADLPPGGFLGG